MPRSYRHIKMYEKEILELVEKGFTKREIGEKLGFTKEQIKEFVKRNNRRLRKIEAGAILQKRGRPRKDDVVTEEMKVAELRYVLMQKERKIKSLEMENELLINFLQATGRK